MPTFNGKFQYLDAKGVPAQAGTCRLSFDDTEMTLVPEKGASLALDLGDIDEFAPGDYELRLRLFNGKTILLHQFGKSFQNLCQQLLDSYRHRLIQCLLLEDLEEVTRLEGFAQLESSERGFSGRAEIRLFESNLAVLPLSTTGLQWRLADIDAVDFDEVTYTLGIRSGTDRLILTRLAKRTMEFREKLQSKMQDLAERSARVLHSLFPFLTPDQFQEVAPLMPEGRAAPLQRLRSIHSKTVQALIDNAVDKHLKPYYAFLERQAAENGIFAGFKVIRKESGEEEAGEESTIVKDTTASDADTPEADSGEEQTGFAETNGEETGEEKKDTLLHFFFFVLRTQPGQAGPSNIVAWEAASHGGRATYFFRLLPPDQAHLLADPARAGVAVESAVRRLNGALGLLNFRREPVYLPTDSLDMQPRFRRYAIACRKLPILQQVRSSFLGRAIHTTPEAWQKQVQSILSKPC